MGMLPSIGAGETYAWEHPQEEEGSPFRSHQLHAYAYILRHGKARTLHFVFHSTSSAFTFFYLPLLQTQLSFVRANLTKGSYLGLSAQAFLTTLNVSISLH